MAMFSTAFTAATMTNKDNALVALDAKNNTAAIIAPLRITPEVFEDFETAAYLVAKGGI